MIIVWVLIHLIYVTVDGLHDHKGHADLAVVLGNKVYPDSSLSPTLQGRVDRAIRLYHEHQVDRIMLSGGTGTDSGYVPEGFAMRRYCLRKGIPDSAIIVDNAGENTFLSAKNLLTLNERMHFSSVIVVSSFYHLTRAKYIIRKLGYKNVYSASSDDFYSVDLFGLGREFVAFYKYMLVY